MHYGDPALQEKPAMSPYWSLPDALWWPGAAGEARHVTLWILTSSTMVTLRCRRQNWSQLPPSSRNRL